jgi:hypothetical protein
MSKKRTGQFIRPGLRFGALIFGQNTKDTLLFNINSFMSLSKLAGVVAIFLGGIAFLAFPNRGIGQTNYYAAYGTEYAVAGSLPGDQVYPDVAVTPTGGFLVWQDNVTDGSGWGISAERLDSTFSGSLSPFRVNVQGTNNQENARVAILKNGGAAFVWQGGARGAQHIFARFLTPTNTWLTTTDLVVSTFTNTFQVNPALTVLNNSNVVIVWASYDEASAGSLLDVYGKILSQTGQTVSNQFLINQFTSFNQRSPAVVALKGGGFVVAWVSEQERSTASTSTSQYYAANAIVTPSVDIYARLYNSNGAALSNEFPVNTNLSPCANPSLGAGSDGGFMVGWSQHDPMIITNGWDIYARPFSSAGVGGTELRVNTHVYGDQYAPKISAVDLDYLIVWTSLGQDGSREGVFGQFVHNNGSPVGNEFQVNTTWVGQQMQPAVASDGTAQFEVVWTSFTGSPYGFDLYSQRYANVSAILQAMSAPFVYAPFNLNNGVYVPQLQVSWPLLAGISVSNFEVYVDGAIIPTVLVATNQWMMGAINGLTTSSTHSFQVDYVTGDDRRSPISPAASGATWSGASYQGVPVEWMEMYYGSDVSTWPVNVNSPLTSGGFSLEKVFLSGGDPLDSTTWLTTTLTPTSEGYFLSWNTQAGQTYQVQESTNLTTWNDLGSPRFAAGASDSIFIGRTSVGFYQVLLLRQ